VPAAEVTSNVSDGEAARGAAGAYTERSEDVTNHTHKFTFYVRKHNYTDYEATIDKGTARNERSALTTPDAVGSRRSREGHRR